ncbi:MAG TPA: hypothetical protein DIC59_05090 [Candidatus Competibacteraceae bacterium]|nr:hypothetical protein [Candidatus Competibacteraceae bacterium]
MNPYSLLNEFSPAQAVQAITGIVQPKTQEEKNTFTLTESSIRADIDSEKLPATITEIPRIREERIGMRRIGIHDTRDHRPVIQHPYTERVIHIARSDLLTWCEQKGISPALLPVGPIGPKLLHTNERNTLLGIIRALAELHGIKASSDAYRKEAEVLIRDLAKKEITQPCNDKTLAKHLKACFESR